MAIEPHYVPPLPLYYMNKGGPFPYAWKENAIVMGK
jgi:hypothetical protein